MLINRARELEEDVLVRSRRVLGDDHPDTLRAQGNLAATLRSLGELDRAGSVDPSEAGPQVEQALGQPHSALPRRPDDGRICS
jgi:Tetratricopeptide repeat